MQGIAVNNKLDADYLALDGLILKDHLLRKINEQINFSFVNELTEFCYSPNNGRPSIPPELYFKMMLIGYLYGIRSTRRLVQDIYYNVSYRWFCGLTLKDAIPNHASLSRIKKRYSVDIFERFFYAILNQCREKGKEIRTITRHIHYDLFQKVLIDMETDIFKKKLAERLWKIEGVMNELKNYHGLFKANYRGLNNVKIQAYMAAIAINIKRIVFLFLYYLINFWSNFNQVLQQAGLLSIGKRCDRRKIKVRPYIFPGSSKYKKSKFCDR